MLFLLTYLWSSYLDGDEEEIDNDESEEETDSEEEDTEFEDDEEIDKLPMPLRDAKAKAVQQQRRALEEKLGPKAFLQGYPAVQVNREDVYFIKYG